MTVEELRTILRYADIQQKQKVQIRVLRKGERHITSVDIDSFKIYSDAIVLNIEVDEQF
jgi:hypothetical protein